MDKSKVIRLLTDSIVATAAAIEQITCEQPVAAERTIKSAYYGLDNALTMIRREIAAAQDRGEDISVQDIERKVGMKSGTASRNVYYWGEGHKDMTGGYEFITIAFDPSDRRKRSLRLTNKGRAFVNQLLGGDQQDG